MPSTCLVSAADYARYWQGVEPDRSGYSGPDRRTGPVDRRAPGHERRWDAQRGRRVTLRDRRQGG